MRLVAAAVEAANKTQPIVRCLLALALVSLSTHGFAVDTGHDVAPSQTTAAMGIWSGFNHRFVQSVLDGLHQDNMQIESHFCGCFDQPRKHFPYSVVIVKAARGDLVARPEGSEGEVRLIPLAVRFGDRYCDIDAEQSCYGTFSHPCDFTDSRYGAQLRPFFPTCHTDEPK